MTWDQRRTIECRNCGQHGLHAAHGLCRWCYDRGYSRGSFDDIPPPRHGPHATLDPAEVQRVLEGCTGQHLTVPERRAAIAALRARGLTGAQIAERLQCSRRTVERYPAAGANPNTTDTTTHVGAA